MWQYSFEMEKSVCVITLVEVPYGKKAGCLK